MTEKTYTKAEETANVVTHAIGILFGVLAGYMLLESAINTRDTWCIVSVVVYIIGMILSFSTSVLYHSCRIPERKAFFRKFDHAAIYVYIAGTYTPITLILLRNVGTWGWILFFIAWTAALVGCLVSLKGKQTGKKIETACYVAMGLVITVAFKPLIEVLSSSGRMNVFYFIVAGGISYIIGAVLYSFKVKYMHSVFHLFVLGGSICHVLAVANIFK